MSASPDVRQLKSAGSLEEIRQFVHRFSAMAQGNGGVLYSGWVGEVRAETIALEIAHRSGLPIINDTPRARFLAGTNSTAIHDAAQRIFLAQGESREVATKLAADFLYGDAEAPLDSPFSIRNCLWCEASREFAGSVRGNVLVVASAADAGRVFAQIETPAILEAAKVETLGGRSLPELRGLEAKGGIQEVLPVIQEQFVRAARKGIFTSPAHSGVTVTQVSVSKEVAQALGLDPEPFIAGTHLRASHLVPATLTPRGQASLNASVADGAVPRDGARPGLGRGAGLFAAAVVAYDLASSADMASSLWKQGNHTGASSEVLHFGTRNLGMWGGAALGAEVFGTAGAETGPWDIVVGGVGALVGAIAGDQLANAMDRQRIYHQRGPDGRGWSYDPEDPGRGWTRTTSELDTGATRLNDGFPVYREQSESADAALADRLNYQASHTAVELALAHPPRPRDPYTQPATPGDTHSLRDAPWNRDPQTHVWTRRVVHELLEHGMVNAHVERATEARAAELDRVAEQTVAENLAHSPTAIASRYASAYREYGWEKYGPLPETVAIALRTTEPGTTALADIGATLRHAERPAAPAAPPAPVPTHLLDFRQAGHPLHAFYERALAKVHDMEDRYRMTYGAHSERLAAAVTDAVAAYNVGKAPDRRFGAMERVELCGEGADRQAVAIDQRVNYHLPQVQVSVPADKAVSRSVEQSSQDWAHRHMPHLQTASQAREADLAVPGNHTWPAYDPRSPDHPRHAQFEALREKVTEAYAHVGIPRTRAQLDEATAVVLLHARDGRLDADSTQVSLLADQRTGVIGPDSDLLLQQNYGTLNLRTRIPPGELQTSPDQAFRQMAQTASQGQPGQEPPQAQAR